EFRRVLFRSKWGKVFTYFYKYKKLFIQLILGMLLGTILQLVTPFLTQAVVDIGINTKNINFINLILIAQLMLFIGQTAVSFIRSWRSEEHTSELQSRE